MENHLPNLPKKVQDVKEDCSNENQPLGCKANLVAPNRNNNNNNMNMNMLNKSDDDSKSKDNDYETLDLDEWLNHDELFMQFNSGLTIPTPGRVHNEDLAPITLLCCDTIQGHHSPRPLVILLDGGSCSSLINKRALPLGAVPSKSKEKHTTKTASGTIDSSLSVGIRNIELPEFSNGRKIDGRNCCAFDAESCQYDLIMGRDFMRHIGIENSFVTDYI